MPRSRNVVCGIEPGRDIFDEETRRKPLAFRADAGHYWSLNRYSTGSSEPTRLYCEHSKGRASLKILLVPDSGSKRSKRKPRPTSTRSVCRASGFVLVGNPSTTFLADCQQEHCRLQQDHAAIGDVVVRCRNLQLAFFHQC